VGGRSISPLLANIYLHHALDLWVHAWRKAQAHGDVVVVRFADDFKDTENYGNGSSTAFRLIHGLENAVAESPHRHTCRCFDLVPSLAPQARRITAGSPGSPRPS